MYDRREVMAVGVKSKKSPFWEKKSRGFSSAIEGFGEESKKEVNKALAFGIRTLKSLIKRREKEHWTAL